MSPLAALLVLVALGLLLAAFWLRQRTGLPWARVAYNDAGERRVERPLFAPRYGLVGKPDYVLEQRGRLVPVEVKPSRRVNEPYYSDVMQLVAYCVLIEETSGRAPRYGLLRYAHVTFQIPYTRALRDDLLAILDAMRADGAADDCVRDHAEPQRCRACGFYAVCTQALE
jgi:CRISPR-associated exonuclease Cas4